MKPFPPMTRIFCSIGIICVVTGFASCVIARLDMSLIFTQNVECNQIVHKVLNTDLHLCHTFVRARSYIFFSKRTAQEFRAAAHLMLQPSRFVASYQY
jgi:hypothetical protein